MGTPVSSAVSRSRSRTVERRPSAATVNVASTRSSPSAVCATTPVTRPAVRTTSVTSAPITSRKPGYRRPSEASRLSRSHCGISAISWFGPRSRPKSIGCSRIDPTTTSRVRSRVCGTASNVVAEPELVHEVERRRVNRVAAEVAEEVGVLLEHDDVDPAARQQKSEHDPGGTAAGDAYPGGQVLGHEVPSTRRARSGEAGRSR